MLQTHEGSRHTAGWWTCAKPNAGGDMHAALSRQLTGHGALRPAD